MCGKKLKLCLASKKGNIIGQVLLHSTDTINFLSFFYLVNAYVHLISVTNYHIRGTAILALSSSQEFSKQL